MRAWEVLTALTATLILALRKPAQAAAPPTSQAGAGALLAACAPPGTQAYATLIAQRASDFGVPASLLAALVTQESGGNANAERFEAAWVSILQGQAPAWDAALALGWTYQQLATSMGLTQVLGLTAWQLGAHYPPQRILEPYLNLGLGAKYLAQQRAAFGTWRDALRAYNAGPTAAARDQAAGAAYADSVIAIQQSILACEATQ